MAKITTAVLRAAGLSPEQIATVLETAAHFAAELKREQTRARVAAHRVRVTQKSVTVTLETPESVTVTQNSVTDRGVDDLNPPKPKAKRAAQLPVDWVLPEEGRAYARGKGFSEARIDSEAERFVNHARATGRVQLNWEAAWRNWVTSPLQSVRGVNDLKMNGGNGNGHRKRTVADAADDLLDRLRALPDDQGSGDLFDRAGENSVRILPPGRRE